MHTSNGRQKLPVPRWLKKTAGTAVTAGFVVAFLAAAVVVGLTLHLIGEGILDAACGR